MVCEVGECLLFHRSVPFLLKNCSTSTFLHLVLSALELQLGGKICPINEGTGSCRLTALLSDGR